MSTAPSEATSTTDKPLVCIPDYPCADIILRTQGSHHLRVPKIFITLNSPVLDELVRRTLHSPGDANDEASLPEVLLPESGKNLRYLLTFILPVFPAIPPTYEETMELLSVAQKYQMEAVLVHIRNMARQNSLPTQLEPALHIYALAQKYKLLPEVLQSARTILKHSMTIENLGDKLDNMPGSSLYELWKYYGSVQTILASDLAKFMETDARGMLADLRCTDFRSFHIPSWVDEYIVSIGNAPNLFNPLEFNIAMTCHIKDQDSDYRCCKCGSISGKTILEFWEALESVVNGSFKKAESGLSLVQEREDSSVQINSTTSLPDSPDVPDASLIIRSSDLVNFRVHKSVLAMTSQVFKYLLSLPQPSDGESVDGLPVIQLPEDSDLLSCLVSILYPLRPVIPKSYEKVLYLLAACQKYEMATVQSYIRDKVSQGEFPAPKGAESFSAYAIASGKGLIPEMETAARQTLDHPMTFEILGDGLRLSEGWALRDLTNFRKRYRDNLVSCFKSFLNSEEPQFKIWIPCVSYTNISHGRYYSRSNLRMSDTNGSLPSWLADLYEEHLNDSQEAFSKPLFNSRSIRGKYSTALHAHVNSDSCFSCTKVHMENGKMFCKNLEDRLTQALNEALSNLISDNNRHLHF